MLERIDRILNYITMYRLVLYYLLGLLAVALGLGAFGLLAFSPFDLLFSTGILVLASLIANELFARVFDAQPNSESVYITALILALIITPVGPTDLQGIAFLLWAAIWSMACKYIFAIDKKHLFNPAAFAVALTSLAINQPASWWGGAVSYLPYFALAGGLLIVRKIQRFDLVLPFFLTSLAMIAATSVGSVPSVVERVLMNTPLFFFAFVMLTEPMTTPPTRTLRIVYGALVGLIYAPALHIGPFHATPEYALLIGNIFSYIVSPKAKRVLTLAEKEEVGAGIYDFRFATDRPFSFRPGQYMEWTLAHDKSDARGNRRYFTLASSPTERDVRLGIRFYEPSSSFKRAIHEIPIGGKIVGGQLAGDFTMPKDRAKKLVFIAGGIGITPFRSMVKYLADQGERRDVVLLYSNRTPNEIAYRDVFEEAEQKLGMRTIYALTGEIAPGTALPPGAHMGIIDANLVSEEIPDYRERLFYISGSRSMVVTFEKMLRGLGVPRRQIKTDFFPGFA